MKQLFKASLAILLLIPMLIGLNVKAVGLNELENKTYNATYEVGGTSNMGKKMIKKYFEEKLMIERIDDYYFISLHQNSSAITGLTLLVDDKPAGWMVREENGEDKITTFTASLDTIKSEMQFTCYITKMGMDQNFTITINSDSITVAKDTVDAIANRPGFFGEKPSFKKVFPMWGYAAIAGGILVLAAAGGIAYVVIKRKHI